MQTRSQHLLLRYKKDLAPVRLTHPLGRLLPPLCPTSWVPLSAHQSSGLLCCWLVRSGSGSQRLGKGGAFGRLTLEVSFCGGNADLEEGGREGGGGREEFLRYVMLVALNQMTMHVRLALPSD